MRSARVFRRPALFTLCALGGATLLTACPAPESGDDASSGTQDAGLATDAGASDLGAGDALARTDSSSGADATTSSCTPGAGDCGGDVCRPSFTTGILECQTAGGVALGATCGSGGVDDCVADGVCFDLFDQGSAVCRPLCAPDSSGIDCPDADQLCVPMWGPQDVGLCVGDDCTPPDAGCDSGERCGLFMGEVLACLPAGEVTLGGDCSTDYCQAGLACVGEGTEYHCRALCQTTTDCDSETHCMWSSEDDWGICALGCDLITQTGCDLDEACYYSDPENADTLCWAEGALAIGADCSSMDLCVAGADCFPDPDTAPDYEYYCRAFCDDTHPCDSGTCQVTERLRGIGLCLP